MDIEDLKILIASRTDAEVQVLREHARRVLGIRGQAVEPEAKRLGRPRCSKSKPKPDAAVTPAEVAAMEHPLLDEIHKSMPESGA